MGTDHDWIRVNNGDGPENLFVFFQSHSSYATLSTRDYVAIQINCKQQLRYVGNVICWLDYVQRQRHFKMNDGLHLLLAAEEPGGCWVGR